MTTVAMIHGKDHLFFKENGGWSSPPLVLINSLALLDLCSQERHICLILLHHRYSLAMALMDLGELAEEFGKSIRQVQRWIKKLKERDLIKVTPRPGRPSIIDVSPLVIAVKKLLNWQEAEQPAAPVETLAEVVPEPDLWMPDDAPEEEAEQENEAAEVWDDLREQLVGMMPRWMGSVLGETEGLRWEDTILVVSVKNNGQKEQMKRFKLQADLLIQDRYENALGVRFEVVKKVKRAPLLTLVAAAVGGV